MAKPYIILFLTVAALQFGHGFGQDFIGQFSGQIPGILSNVVQAVTSNSSERQTIEQIIDVLQNPGLLVSQVGRNGIPKETLDLLMELKNQMDQVDGTCLQHMMAFVQGLGTEEWAMRMLDAMAKPPAGLLNYKLLWLGDWGECISTKALVNNSGVMTELFNGKYCGVSLNIPGVAGPFGQPIKMQLATCFPDSCSSNDVLNIIVMLNYTLTEFNVSLPVPTVQCKENELPLDTRAIAVIAVCTVFLAIMTLATVYDVLYIQWMVKQQPKQPYQNGSATKDGLSAPEVYVVTDGKGPDSMSNGYEMTSKTNLVDTMAPKGSGHSSKNGTYKPSTLEGILLSFSVYTNGCKILNTHQPKGALTAINGIRFISMSWVIVGHTYAWLAQPGSDNFMQFAGDLIQRKEFTPIVNGTFSVDTFFVLSGLLLTYLSLKEMKKVGGATEFRWGMYYFHRIWRLTPPYMLVLMLNVSFDKYLGDGPMWPQQGLERSTCAKSWWTNILYINNLVTGGTDGILRCMGHSWYLANDMQFYVISPLLIIPLFYFPIVGGIACLLAIAASAVATGFISIGKELPSSTTFNIEKQEDYMWDYYVKPWCRIGPYIVGMFTGYMLHKSKLNMKINKVMNAVLWLVSIVLGCLIIYGLYTDDYQDPLTVKQAAVYNAISRSLWGACVAWVIFSCANGYGGPINVLLSWPGFVPLGRLTYLAYLVHPILMSIYQLSLHSLQTLYTYGTVYTVLGHMCMAYGVAFVLSLAFEAPMMGLEKVLLGRGKNN